MEMVDFYKDVQVIDKPELKKMFGPMEADCNHIQIEGNIVTLPMTKHLAKDILSNFEDDSVDPDFFSYLEGVANNGEEVTHISAHLNTIEKIKAMYDAHWKTEMDKPDDESYSLKIPGAKKLFFSLILEKTAANVKKTAV